jgi:acetyl esterase/lipase
LPPAWIYTVTLDLFRDENIAYAQRLMRAGVATELIVEPGACHGFTMIPETQILQRYNAASLSALRRAIGAR